MLRRTFKSLRKCYYLPMAYIYVNKSSRSFPNRFLISTLGGTFKCIKVLWEEPLLNCIFTLPSASSFSATRYETFKIWTAKIIAAFKGFLSIIFWKNLQHLLPQKNFSSSIFCSVLPKKKSSLMGRVFI